MEVSSWVCSTNSSEKRRAPNPSHNKRKTAQISPKKPSQIRLTSNLKNLLEQRQSHRNRSRHQSRNRLPPDPKTPKLPHQQAMPKRQRPLQKNPRRENRNSPAARRNHSPPRNQSRRLRPNLPIPSSAPAVGDSFPSRFPATPQKSPVHSAPRKTNIVPDEPGHHPHPVSIPTPKAGPREKSPSTASVITCHQPPLTTPPIHQPDRNE